MKTTYLLSLLSVISCASYAQVDTTNANAKSQIDTTINLDLLRSPISPASNLLGISPNEIQRPTDVKAFMVSVQNASQGFSAVPSSFGVDIAPYWFAKKASTFLEQTSKDNRFLKSFLLSVAVRNYQSKAKVDSTTQVGIGFRVSLKRGEYNRKDVLSIYKAFEDFTTLRDGKQAGDLKYQKAKKMRDSLATMEKEELVKFAQGLSRDSTNYKSIKSQRLVQDSLIAQRNQDIVDILVKEKSDIVKTFIDAKPVRTGFKLDLAGGLAWDFTDTKFNNGKVFKAGTWLTGGWELNSGHAFLFILRYLYNPVKVFADDKGVLKSKAVSTYDGGVRYNFQAKDNPFSISTEFLYRGVAAKELDNTWRAVLNANYEVSKNTILTLSLGRDFDKTFKKDGNVIAFLNFVKAFGF